MDGRDHERFEVLAVGHVLGGLDERDSTLFRTHLVECRECRARVAELRDIAADLAAAEREERQLARTKTEVARRTEEQTTSQEVEGGWRWPSPRLVAVAVAVGALLVVGLGYWSFHLRTVNAEALRAARSQERVLEVLASGEPASLDLDRGISGQVRATGSEVAISLVGLPGLRADQRFVVWLDGPGDPTGTFVGASDGRLALPLDRGTATTVLISVEAWPPPQDREAGPQGEVLVRAELADPNT